MDYSTNRIFGEFQRHVQLDPGINNGNLKVVIRWKGWNWSISYHPSRQLSLVLDIGGLKTWNLTNVTAWVARSLEIRCANPRAKTIVSESNPKPCRKQKPECNYVLWLVTSRFCRYWSIFLARTVADKSGHTHKERDMYGAPDLVFTAQRFQICTAAKSTADFFRPPIYPKGGLSRAKPKLIVRTRIRTYTSSKVVSLDSSQTNFRPYK